MADVQRKLVHKQFNSPMGLYSQQNVAETLNRELKAFGSQGIEIDEQIAKPLNLANSAVLRAVEEEEEMKCGYKRVAWPPASEERIVREFTPQPQTQYQPVPAYNQQQQQQPSSAAPAQAPIYNNVSHQAPTNINNMARDCNSPYKPNPNPNQIQYEPFPPQTPETPIILKDKQFSRQASQEPNQTNTLPYHQQQQQHHHQQQQQQYQYQQPQNQPIQQYGQQQYGQQQQQHYQHHQEPYYQQQHQQQQQPIHYPSNQQEQIPQQQKHQQQQDQHALPGWKPIRPPQTKQEHLFTSPSGIRESTPSMTGPVYQQQYQNYQQQPQPQQQQQQQPQQYHQQQYRAPSYDIYQQPQQQQQPPQQQYPPQAQYQSQAPLSQNQYQQPPQAVSHYQQQPPHQQQPAWAHQQQQPQQQQHQPQQQQYQQPPWVQQSQQNQQYQQSQYQSPLNQYNQAPIHHQAQQQHQQQQQPQQQQYNNQFVSQSNQQQFNSYSQPQQQQHTVSHDQVDQHAKLAQDQRGISPGIITLRKEAPITQQPAPVYSSQPAAISFRESSADVDSLGGANMRGDLKWPPPEYKEAAAKENDERRKLALGPVCRPRKINRDYTAFFAKNALSHHYPSYKVPPGTQHMTY